MSKEAIVKILAEFGEFYWSQGDVRKRDRLHNLASGFWREALIEFLRGFAFERQGASPHYSGAAIAAVQKYPDNTPRGGFEAFVWETFLDEIHAAPNAKGAAKKVNPLAPTYGKAKSVTLLIFDLVLHDYNLIKWAADGMANGQLEHISAEIQSVRGIGTKIAAFFLRDIAVAFEIPETKRAPAELLQPIDVWTRRGAEVLADIQPASQYKMDDLGAARVIIELSRKAGVSPELVNTGLWILGANFARTKDKYQASLASIAALRQFLAGERDYHIVRGSFLDKLLHND